MKDKTIVQVMLIAAVISGAIIGYDFGTYQEAQPITTKAEYLEHCFDNYSYWSDNQNESKHTTLCVIQADSIYGEGNAL